MPAAVCVITQEDLRRSGATSIPEALRMVPGVQVARIDANKWAISIRGFNGRLANKVLPMIDGRRIQTPVFSGVYWDLQDVVREDVERIEVVRGPGAARWGAGAVNGVVNVITKHARATQGGLLTGGGGTEERGFGGMRYGGQVGGAYFRAYAKYFQRDRFLTASGEPGQDDWSAVRGGFRLDWAASARDALRLQGDLYRGDAHQQVAAFFLSPPFERNYLDHARFDAGDLLARWERAADERSRMALPFYCDHTHRAEAINAEETNTVDVEFQRRRPLGESHDLQWGLEARLMSDHLPSGLLRSFEPARRRHTLF